MTETKEHLTKELMKEKERLIERTDKLTREEYVYQELKRLSMTPRPVVCLCGSCTLEDKYREVAAEFSLMDAIILDPEVWGKWHELHGEKGKTAKQRLDATHFAKIRMADIIYILDNGEGESTSREVKYAREMKKPFYYYSTTSPKEVMSQWMRRGNSDNSR